MRRGEALGQPAVVDEHERRAVRRDQFEQLVLQRRPDAVARFGSSRRPGRCITLRRRLSTIGLPSCAMSSTGTTIWMSNSFGMLRVDDRDRAGTCRRSARRGSGRPLRAGAAWPTARCAGRSRLRRASRRRVARGARARAPGARRAWCRATAWISSTITTSTPASAAARLARQQQIQRLGRGDEHVGWVTHQRAALVGRRVAGAGADADVGQRQAGALATRWRCR